MNGYIAFYQGKRVEVEAETSLKAQEKAAALLKVKKAWRVNVILAEKDGEAVVHKPQDLCP